VETKASTSMNIWGITHSNVLDRKQIKKVK